MKRGHQRILEEYLDGMEYLVPITNEDLCDYLADRTGERPEAVRPSVNMAMSRLEKTRRDLFRFQNGIYYRTKNTVFGYAKLDPGAVIYKKYITDKDEIIGYETGLSLMNKAGLTTQVPAHRFVATNRHRGRGLIEDAPLKVFLSRPITKVTRSNYLYLQTLELITALIKNRDDIQTDDPRGLIYEHIKRSDLDAAKLAYYAGECGGGKLADELVKIYYEGARNEIA
ncbi:MAG: DUF6088 family protein [Methanomassiliicoccaceae archaeon]|jgi:hypothetical protein|nr:DUF6088 family protein [Methanomassiliicoccaceae archaeon]